MVLPQVARLAHAPRIQLPVRVLAFRGQLVPPLGVVAVFAHARSVVLVVDVLTFGDCLPVLDPFPFLWLLRLLYFGVLFLNGGLFKGLLLSKLLSHKLLVEKTLFQ